MIDGHVHLENGDLSVEYAMQFVEAAAAKGIDTLQILDHTHRFIEFSPMYDGVRNASPLQAQWLSKKIKDHLSDYHRLIDEMKQIKLPVRVLFGLEVCYTPEAEPFLKETLSQFPYDFLVGSIHSIDGILYDMPFSRELLWDVQEADAIYQRYYTLLEQVITSGLFTQVAHPDTIKLFNIYPSYDLHPTFERLAKLAAAHHVKMENNTGCHYRYHTEDIGLSDAFITALVKEDASIITASDAHYPDHVGNYIREATQRIEEIRDQISSHS